MTKVLARISITANGDDYRLRLETGDGEVFEVVASFEQLDLLAEDIDRRLDADEDNAAALPASG